MTSGVRGGNNKVGSRPPVCFAEYAQVRATLPGVAGTVTAQQYQYNYTPEVGEIQRLLGKFGGPLSEWRTIDLAPL